MCTHKIQLMIACECPANVPPFVTGRVMSKLNRQDKDLLITLERIISERFDDADWRRLALTIEADDVIIKHPRLLRALTSVTWTISGCH
ncbi:MAG: hypothetical protein IPH85_00120 [Ignavibacteria bacterium]|nr:hypothetical protein [Ignavibacteria bacterium]